MSISVLALGLAYALLLLLLLLAVFKSELGAGLKLTLATLCLAFYPWHYEALQDYRGWPAQDALPDNFELISSYSLEPDLKQDREGAIYIWIRNLDRDGAKPRAYRFDYRKRLHRKINDTLQRQGQGERFVGRPATASEAVQGDIEFDLIKRASGTRKPASSQ